MVAARAIEPKGSEFFWLFSNETGLSPSLCCRTDYEFLRTVPLMPSSFARLCGRRSGQSVTASDFGSNGPRFESGRGRCVESLDKALYSHCPKEKPSH